MKKKIKENIINIGTGKDYTIKQYVKMLLKIMIPNKKIRIIFDLTKPNGTPKKVLDISLAKKYGWKPKIKFNQAILSTYKNFWKYSIEKYNCSNWRSRFCWIKFNILSNKKKVKI